MICLDTNVVIRALNDRFSPVRNHLNLLSGPISVLPFDPEDGKEAGHIRAILERAGIPIGPYDVLIAAQATRRGATLVTSNTAEFARIPQLNLEDWTAR